MLFKLFNLHLANIKILLCLFFLVRVVFNNSFIIDVVIENAKLQVALSIHTGVVITVPNDAIEIPPLVLDKTIRVYQWRQYIYKHFYLLVLFYKFQQ